ncbi:hypothetical protein IW140_005927 [Coemansia sp. RSA 1813]|nr:hypothetical protein LPJ74_004752 [Coemansia sp. RSA 1843]KAJ2210871.1 hypothetical protein EV179_005923 [Coemansia sp. RSA 487]KAJ2563929.1 hypothetical protein IW140_005927 [Coemansia sp. RSA 1813]
MPLLHGQPVDLQVAQPTDNGAVVRTQGWEIRYTGEVFTDYDKYLDRISFYRKPVWTCKDSGQSGLTYEQAQLSERAFQHRATGVGFSDMLICEMLTFLSQSSLPIAQAIDALYYRFQHDFFAGEHIDVKYPGTDGEMYECFVVSIHPLPQPPALGTFTPNDTVEVFESPTKIAIDRLGDAADRVIAYELRKARLYTVRLYDIEGNPIDDSDICVPAAELGRSRNVFTKVAIRQFLDDHMRRDPRPGSPWIVLPQWRERFRIPYMFGGEACMLRAAKPIRRVSNIHDARDLPVSALQQHTKKKNIVVDPYADERDPHIKIIKKFPVDDLELVNYKHVKWSDGIVWALRRRYQKLAGEEDKPIDGQNGSSRKITEFFTLNPPTNGQEDHKDKDKDKDKDEEEEEDEEDEPLRNRWPVPLSTWQVPTDLVSRMLAAYMFVSFFSTPLALSAYSLDYFESALMHSLPGTNGDEKGEPPCSVYRDTVIALLNSIIEDRQRDSPLPSNVSMRIELMVDSHQKESPSDTAEANIKMDVDEAAPKANGTTRIGKSRLSQSVSMLDDSAAHSSYSDDDESGATSSATLDSKKKKNGRRAQAGKKRKGREARGSAVSSAAATPAETDDESVAGADDKNMGESTGERVASLGGKELLGYAAREWAVGSKIDASRNGWAWRLVGWIGEAQYDYTELQPINAALEAIEPLTADSLELTLWNILPLEQRLLLLELLIGESANNETMRTYIDQCAEATAELKRERIELRREQRRVAEQLGELDKEEDEEGTNGDTAASSRAQGRKEKEQSVQRQKERRKLGETERQTQRRLDYVEREIRRNNVARLAPLGTDRFFNKYYFIDGIGGCPMSNGSGRILVQAASKQERVAALGQHPRVVATAWALEMPPAWTNGLECCARDRGLLELAFPEEKPPPSRDGEQWGYYATPSQIEVLKRWLDTRGRRDAALVGELDLLQTAISTSIRRRCHVLERSLDARVRVRDSICDQIGSLLLDDERDAGETTAETPPEVVRLREELARIDRIPVPQALLPPQMLVDQQQQYADSKGVTESQLIRPAELNGTTTDSAAASVYSGTGGDTGNMDSSSRASSVEPSADLLFAHQASLHASARRQGVLRPTRGRRPKTRVGARPRTFVDDLMAYENGLLQ